jgi:hypothetical protein
MTAKAEEETPPMTAPVINASSESRSQTLSKYRPNPVLSPQAFANEPSTASRQAPIEKPKCPRTDGPMRQAVRRSLT